MSEPRPIAERAAPGNESDVRKFFREVREQGLVTAVKHVGHVLTWRFHHYVDRDFDRKFGVHTSSEAYSWDLNLKSEGDDIGDDEPLYLPTSSIAFKAAMSRLPRDLSRFVFIDYGSGMGRTLLLASNFGFKRIIGIEFANELHAIAGKNIERYRHPHQRCFDLHSEHVDATLYSPPDEPCVFYLFHPFEEVVMTKVVSRIRASFEARPRKMYIVYYKPRYSEVFERQQFLREQKPPLLTPRRWFPNPYGLKIFETI